MYDGYDLSDTKILVRSSVYDPKYIMPSQTTFIININLAPVDGSIDMLVTRGTALMTEYSLVLKDFKDVDSPFSYRYGFYVDQKDYDYEV